MKYALLTVLALFVSTTVAIAQDVTKADVVKLSKAGLGDQVIIEFLRTRNTRITLTASDVVDLKAAGVADSVVKFMLKAPSKEKGATNGGCGATEARTPAVTTVVTTPIYRENPYYYGYYGYGYGYPYRYGYYYPYSYSHVYSRPWHYGYSHHGYSGYGHGSYGGGHGYSSHGGTHGGGHSGGGHSGGGHR